jgi:23S rRNA (uracil1939-C5)-methyltransferase
LDPRVGLLIEEMSQWLHSLSIKENIPQLELASTDDECALIIRHLEPFIEEDLAKLRTFAQTHQLKLYLQPKGIDSIYLFEPPAADPKLYYRLAEQNLNFQFHPAQFTQVNHEINQLMIKQALHLLDLQPDDRVLDLFCGIGNFSLPIAQLAGQVIGVEGDESSVVQAKTNATINQIANVDFYSSNLFADIQGQPWAKLKYQKILLDPPRAGAFEIIGQFQKWQPEKIVYVSCNPATLARDAKSLIAQGYTLQSAGIMDMFPHTQHVEVMALFCK